MGRHSWDFRATAAWFPSFHIQVKLARQGFLSFHHSWFPKLPWTTVLIRSAAANVNDEVTGEDNGTMPIFSLQLSTGFQQDSYEWEMWRWTPEWGAKPTNFLTAGILGFLSMHSLSLVSGNTILLDKQQKTEKKMFGPSYNVCLEMHRST